MPIMKHKIFSNSKNTKQIRLIRKSGKLLELFFLECVWYIVVVH